MADIAGLQEATGSRFSQFELIGRGSFGDVYKAPSAKELLKHRFIRNARKSPRLLERVRECPKYEIKEDGEILPNGPNAIEEGFDTVMAKGDIRGKETIQASSWAKTFKNAGWDFSIGEPQSTGTIRSSVKPPQVKERRPDVPRNWTRDTPASAESGNALKVSQEVSSRNDARDLYYDADEDNHYDDDDMSMSVCGTVVIRSSRGSESLSLQSSVSSGQHASLEDASTSGTVVLRGQHDGSDSPRTPKSRLGILERNSIALLEDTATNLAEAKAAMQAGLRKGNAKGRSAMGKIGISALESQRGDEMANSSDSSGGLREYFDAEKAFPRSHQANCDDERVKTVPSSAPLSMLLIPSLEVALADDLEGSVVLAVTNSMVNMERKTPGYCQALICKLLERLASSKESSLKEMQEMVAPMFIKGKAASEDTQNMTAEAENRRRQQQKELHTNFNISPLARFLLSRWQSQVSKDLNPA